MQLEWIDHSVQLVEGVSQLLGSSQLLDVTLTAEGKKLRAHRLVLSAASTYFRDILTSEENDKSPIIFLRDVTFNELECLIQFIYSGHTTVQTTKVEEFLRLAKALGLKGFEEDKENNISKKMKRLEKKSEMSPFKKSSASEPVNMPSYYIDLSPTKYPTNDESSTDEGSQKKKRRLQSKSLDEMISPPQIFKTPNHLKNPATSLSPLVLPSFWTSAPVTLSPANTPGEKVVSGDPPAKVQPAPVVPQRQSSYLHSSHLSCPVDSVSPKREANSVSNFSFDSGAPFPDPNELAAKGATLLHHLALWMIEDKKNKQLEEENRIKQEASNKSLQPPEPQGAAGGHRHRGSECDRPDSGFDSKDEDEAKNGGSVAAVLHKQQVSEAISEEKVCSSGTARSASEASSSPDTLTEISRQAPIRQPIFRKRRIHIN